MRKKDNGFIYTGFQIINKSLFNDISEKIFSINKIWDNQINLGKLFGFETKEKFIHLTDTEIYNKLIKN